MASLSLTRNTCQEYVFFILSRPIIYSRVIEIIIGTHSKRFLEANSEWRTWMGRCVRIRSLMDGAFAEGIRID